MLWAIQEAESHKPGTVRGAVASLGLSKKLDPDPEQWTFGPLIEVAREMALIKDDTARQSRLCKDFRNLIHPGRAGRLAQVCDRATALSALAAVEHVARDLMRVTHDPAQGRGHCAGHEGGSP